MKDALILIDIQNDYFPGGKMPLEGSVEASEQARLLLVCFRQAHLPLFHIQHISTRAGATFFLPDTEGVQINANLQPLKDEVVIQKHFPNSFRDTTLLDQLNDRGVTRLIIAGMMTHMCVDATARAACDFGFECLIAGDACATRALKFADKTVAADSVHHAFLAALNGTYGQVLTTREVIARVRA